MPRRRRPDLGRRSQSNVRRATSRANRTDDQRETDQENNMVVQNEVPPDNQSQKPPVDNRYAALAKEFNNTGVLGRRRREEFYQYITLPYTNALAQYARAAGGPPVTVALTRPIPFAVPPVPHADPAANQQGNPSAPAAEEIRHHDEQQHKLQTSYQIIKAFKPGSYCGALVPQIDAAIRQIMALGFINHQGWITQLMEQTNGDANVFILYLDKCIEMQK